MNRDVLVGLPCDYGHQNVFADVDMHGLPVGDLGQLSRALVCYVLRTLVRLEMTSFQLAKEKGSSEDLQLTTPRECRASRCSPNRQDIVFGHPSIHYRWRHPSMECPDWS